MPAKRRVKITEIGFCHLWLTEKHSLIFVKHKFIESAPKNAFDFCEDFRKCRGYGKIPVVFFK